MWYILNNTIQSRLNEAFDKYAGKTALEYGDKRVTYGDLNRKSKQIANYIIGKGMQKGTLIGVLAENRAELISTIIGILRAGCVFVPLDSSYPVDRLRSMITSTRVKLIFTDGCAPDELWVQLKDEKQNTEVAVVDEEFFNTNDTLLSNIPEAVVSPDDMIYIYFTSGTSGKPKAIAGQNKSLMHFINWEINTFGIDQNSRISQFTSCCHDPFLRDVFVPLCSGGTVCIPPDKETILITGKLVNWIEKSEITLIHCTPGLFRIFGSSILTANNFKCLRYILLAGEKIVSNSLALWYSVFGDRIQLVNMYGPTETTLAKVFYLIKPSDVKNKSIPIGKPIDGAKVIILDQEMNILSHGEVGEIYIRTPYRTMGYYNDPEHTSLRFIPNPFSNNTEDLIYKTGDLGRLLPDGNIEFLGRADRQVKIRGFRVELGEIENRLLQLPDVQECVVDFREYKSSSILPDEIVYCTKCGLPSTYPDTVFDLKGVCNTCRAYENYKDKSEMYFKRLEELLPKFEKAKTDKNSEYDCLLLYSGGKDSTYVLYKLVEMGLRVLAYTFDNGFISEVALENTQKIVKELGVDHIVDRYQHMNRIFTEGLKDESSVCNGCFKVLRARSTKMAYEKGIPLIVTGFSRGQIYELRLSELFKHNIFDLNDVEHKIFEQRMMYFSKKDYVSDVMGSEIIIDRGMLKKVELIDFYRYSDITKEEILQFLKNKSTHWHNPLDTGYCSSNCRINDVGIYIQRKERGFDNYTYPTSWEVRTGHIPLEQANKELKGEVDTVKVKDILKELGYDEQLKNKGSQEECLAAYFTADRDIPGHELMAHLEKRLPEYMVPSYFIKLPKIPLTTNKKIDYKALPDPRKSTNKEFIPPRDDIEKEVAGIWTEILGVEKISVSDNFLKIGGHSLNLMTLISKIYQKFGVEIPLGEIFNSATLEGIAKYIKESVNITYDSIAPVTKRDYYPVSDAQKVIFTLSQMKGKKSVGVTYNIPSAVVVQGKVDAARFEKALNQLAQRHEVLRTSYAFVDNNPVQVIQEHVEIKLDILERENGNIDDIVQELIKPFDLSKAPLLRVCLIKLDEDKHVLFYDIHHIISDGVSVSILLKDFLSLYRGEYLPPLRIQYKDYLEWLNGSHGTADLQRMEKYWVDIYKDGAPELTMPLDYERPWMQSFEGDNIFFEAEKDLTAKLEKVAEDTGTTVFMVLLAALYIVLSKYSKQEDVVVGTPITGRPHPELENLMGMFVNIIALRNRPESSKSIRSFLQEVKDASLKAYENQNYPFGRLVSKLGVQKGLGRNPLFDVMLIWQNVEKLVMEIDQLKFTPYNISKKSAEFDITLEAEERKGAIFFRLEYCTKLFRKETVQRFAKSYLKVLDRLAGNLDIQIRDIALND